MLYSRLGALSSQPNILQFHNHLVRSQTSQLHNSVVDIQPAPGLSNMSGVPQTPRGDAPTRTNPPAPRIISYHDIDDDYGARKSGSRSARNGRSGQPRGGGKGGSNGAYGNGTGSAMSSARSYGSLCPEDDYGAADGSQSNGSRRGVGCGNASHSSGNNGAFTSARGSSPTSPFPSARGTTSATAEPVGVEGQRTSMPTGRVAAAAVLAAAASAAAQSAACGPLDPVQGLRGVEGDIPPRGPSADGGHGGSSAVQRTGVSGAVLAPLHAPDVFRAPRSNNGDMASLDGASSGRTTPKLSHAAVNGGSKAGRGFGNGGDGGVLSREGLPGVASKVSRSGTPKPGDTPPWEVPKVPQPALTKCLSINTWALHLEQGAQNLEGVLGPLVAVTLADGATTADFVTTTDGGVGTNKGPWDAQAVLHVLAAELHSRFTPSLTSQLLPKAQAAVKSVVSRPEGVTSEEAEEGQVAMLKVLQEVYHALSVSSCGGSAYHHKFLEETLMPELLSAITYAEMLVADIKEARVMITPRVSVTNVVDTAAAKTMARLAV